MKPGKALKCQSCLHSKSLRLKDFSCYYSLRCSQLNGGERPVTARHHSGPQVSGESSHQVAMGQQGGSDGENEEALP